MRLGQSQNGIAPVLFIVGQKNIFAAAHFFFDKPKAVWDISPVMKTKYTYFLHVYPKAGHRVLDNRPARPFRRSTQKSKAETNADTLVFSTPAVDHIVLEKCDEEGEFIETLWKRSASTFPSFRNE